MRLTKIKVVEILTSIIGEDGIPLIEQLLGKDNISEFDLATKTKKDIKIVRRMLYLLYNHNLVSFTRKKDKQKGWYIYYWTLLPESIRFNYFKMKRDLLERLKKRLEEEKQELFFVCPNKCLRLNFDNAMGFEFHCPECGELISQDNQDEKIAHLEKRIGELQIEFDKLQEQRKVRRTETRTKRKEVVSKKKIIARKKRGRKVKEKKTIPKSASKKTKLVKGVSKSKKIKGKSIAKKKVARKKASVKKFSSPKKVKKTIKKKVKKK